MKIINIHNTPREATIKEAVAALKAGKLLIYPTETCYGLGVDATNPQAVDKLLAYKGARRGKPISVAVAGQKMAQKYVILNQMAKNLYQNFLPGPLTVVSQSRGRVDPRLEAQGKTLGIRIPDYPLVLEIIKTFARPITATSANISGGKTPYQISDILPTLSPKKKKLIGVVLDAGKLPKNPPSTVVDTTLNELKVLRQGPIDFSQGTLLVEQTTNSPEQTQNLAKAFLEKRVNLLKKQALIFALQGELGAGKTQFAKGLAAALGIKTTITSPTFIFAKEYPFGVGKIKGVFCHIDAWRLPAGEQLWQLAEPYINPGNVLAIEWIQKGQDFINKIKSVPSVRLFGVEILHQGKTKRAIQIIPILPTRFKTSCCYHQQK